MSRFGLDWAWGHVSSAALRRSGVTFAGRYISTPGNSKNITLSEAKAHTAAGIDTFLVFETTSGRATAGFAAGQHDARSALSQAAAAGAPSGIAIYFAVDFDASWQSVASYFKGVASVLGVRRTGAYGGIRVIEGLFNAGLITFGWQTLAWSGGRWSSRAQVHQESIERSFLGLNCDYNHAFAPDFAQWRVGQKPHAAPTNLELDYQRKITVWSKELHQIRVYIHQKGNGWHRHPVRWARARRLKAAIGRTEKKLKLLKEKR